MADLKPGWRKYRFDQIAHNVNQRVDDPTQAGVEHYIGLDHLDSDSLKIRRWGSPSDVSATKLLFEPGDIIFGRRRAYQRKLGVAEFRGIASAHALVLRAKPEVALPEFLPFFMQSDLFMQRAQEISVGSLSPTINWKTLAKQEFVLPPLEEQRRVFQLLQSIETTMSNMQDGVIRLERLFQAACMDTFRPERHPRVLLGSVLAYASDGPFGSKLKSEHYAETGVRVVRLQNIDQNKWNNADKAYVSIDYFQSALSSLELLAGDVLLAGLGDDRIPPGRACIIAEDVLPALNKADCFCLRTNRQLRPEFLMLYLNSCYGLQQSASFSQGTTRLRLNLTNIKRMWVPLPALDIQERLAKPLLQHLDLLDGFNVRREHLTALRKRCLIDILSGREDV